MTGKISPIILLTAFSMTAVFASTGCGSKKKSDRDARREQIRNNAESKRKELKNIEGEYFGLIQQDSSAGQSVTLKIEIKDIPSAEDGEVDPVMIPTLSGYLRFNYGGTNTGSEEEYIGFGITNGEYNQKTEKLNLVVENDEFKKVVLDLSKQANELEGTWTAPSLSESGDLSLSKSKNSGGSALLGDYPLHELRGEYGGYLVWNADDKFQYAKITLNTALIPPDNFKLSATTRLYFGDWSSAEYLTYSFNQVEFNPITGQVTIRDDGAEISFTGTLSNGEINGEWFTNYSGKMGAANFVRNDFEIEVPDDLDLASPLHGTYYGKLSDTHPEANFPERILFSFVSGEDSSKPRGLSVTGKIRFYIGPYESTEFIEVPFSSVEFNFYTRKLVAKTTDGYNLTVKADVLSGKISGELLYDALGKVGNIDASKGSPSSGGEYVGGEYLGLLKWDGQNAYQYSNLTLITAYDADEGLKISATSKLIFGDWTSLEYLTYKYDNVSFNPTTGQIILKSENADVSFKGYLDDGEITGDWFSDYTGKLGTLIYNKGTPPTPDSSLDRFSAINGSYRGRLTNTNAGSNLPERFMVSFVTGRDPSQPNGIKITGNVRFYLGDFNSQEYVEMDLSEIRFNFFTRELVASTSGEETYTINGFIEPTGISGKLFHDALGEVADYEVEKQ
ncbi:MAG: hypothetical protein R3B45_07670 [Bdellovibrionota bacterium]